MTDYYVRSTDGNNADSGLTWALAKATIAGFAALDAAGDRCFVSQAHAESTAGSVIWAFAGTPTSCTQVICGNDGAEPPTALAATATATLTGASPALTITGSVYFYGHTFIVGTSGNPNISLGGGNTIQVFENCKFQCGAGSTGGRAFTGAANSGQIIRLLNCEVKFQNAAQGLGLQNGYLHWNGGGITSGSTSPTSLFTIFSAGGAPAVGGVRMLVENCDFSAGASGMNIIGQQVPTAVTAVFRNCKMPSGWSGSWVTAFTGNSQGRIEVFNCANGSTNVAYKVVDGAGTIDHETTLIKAGGATDGATGISWKMVSDSDVIYPISALASSEMLMWVTQTGVAKTFTISLLHDSATNLKNNDAWLELNYRSASGDPLCTLVSSRVDVLTAATDLSADTSGWTTTGMASPNKQKLSVTFTPQAAGMISARVYLAKPSYTLYVDPAGVLT